MFHILWQRSAIAVFQSEVVGLTAVAEVSFAVPLLIIEIVLAGPFKPPHIRSRQGHHRPIGPKHDALAPEGFKNGLK